MCFYILTSNCASRHNGVQFFISHLASWLRTRRFSKPTFRPAGATNHWKNTVFRDFPTFSRTWIFFLLRLSLFWSSFFFSSSLLFSSLLFSSLPFFDSYHLCFSSVHIVGSLTSKLPSIIISLQEYKIQQRWWLVCHCQITHLLEADQEMHLGVSSDFLVRELKDRVERVGGKCWKFGVTWGMGNGSWPEEYDELQHLDGIHFMGTAPIFDPAHTKFTLKGCCGLVPTLCLLFLLTEFHCKN